MSNRSELGETRQKALFSIGDCPVCADSGAVIVLKAARSRRLLFMSSLWRSLVESAQRQAARRS